MKTKTIRQTVDFEGVTPEQVYLTLMTSKGHTDATGGTACIEAKAGAPFTAWDGYIRGTNKQLVAGKKIVQTWRTSEFSDDMEDSILTIELKPAKSKNGKTGTQLKLTHSNVPAEQADNYDQGWHDNYWEPMKSYFANHK